MNISVRKIGLCGLLVAAWIVYSDYRRKQYCWPIAGYVRQLLIMLKPNVTTFGVLVGGKIVKTASMLLDRGRLSAEKIYAREVSELRNCGPLAEIILLAGSKKIPGVDCQELHRRLFLQLLEYGRDVNLARCCITVNPRHKVYYVRKLFFNDAGPLVKRYSRVNAPAVLLSIPVPDRYIDLKQKLMKERKPIDQSAQVA